MQSLSQKFIFSQTEQPNVTEQNPYWFEQYIEPPTTILEFATTAIKHGGAVKVMPETLMYKLKESTLYLKSGENSTTYFSLTHYGAP